MRCVSLPALYVITDGRIVSLWDFQGAIAPDREVLRVSQAELAGSFNDLYSRLNPTAAAAARQAKAGPARGAPVRVPARRNPAASRNMSQRGQSQASFNRRRRCLWPVPAHRAHLMTCGMPACRVGSTSASVPARVARSARPRPRLVRVQRQLIDTPVPGLSELDAQTPELEIGVEVPGDRRRVKSVKGIKNLTAS